MGVFLYVFCVRRVVLVILHTSVISDVSALILIYFFLL